jgi:alpha-tubulin suppressor-like RCC1 family protein
MHKAFWYLRIIILIKFFPLALFSALPTDLPFPAPFMQLPGLDAAQINPPYFAYHPKDDITVIADASGTLFRKGSTSAFFQVQGIQRSGESALHPPGTYMGQTAKLNQLDIERTLISERIETRPEGIKQTFIIRNRIDGTGDLELPIRMDGTYAIRETHDDHLVLEDGEGIPMLYDNLYVYDATGKELFAKFVSGHDGNSFIIRVEDAGAVYPVEVDPLFRPFRSQSPSGGTRPSDVIEITDEGTVVKIDGDLVFVGVPGLDLQLGAATDAFRKSALNLGTANYNDGKFTAMNKLLQSGLASLGLLEAPRIDDVGAVYVFGLIDEAWELIDVLNDWNTAARYDRAKFRPTRLDGGRFGETISVNGNSVMIGAPGIKSETWINAFVSQIKIAGPHTIGGLYFFELPSIGFGFLRRGAVYGIRVENSAYSFLDGYDVADYREVGRALDMAEDLAVVASGAPFDPFQVGGAYSGYGPSYLHHYTRNGTSWTRLPDPPLPTQLPGTVQHLHIAGENVYVIEQVNGYTKLSMYPFPASGENFVPGVYQTWNTVDTVAFDADEERIVLGFPLSSAISIIELDSLQSDPIQLDLPEGVTFGGHLALTGNLLACAVKVADHESISLYSRDDTTGQWSLIETAPSTHSRPIRSMDMDTSGLATLSYDPANGKSPLHVLSLNRSISGTVTRTDGSPVANFAVVPISEPTAIPAHGARLFDGANFVPFEKAPWTINREWGCGLFFSVDDAFPHLDRFSLEITFTNVPPEMEGKEFIANVSLPLQDYTWYGKDYYDYPGFGQGRGIVRNGTVTVDLWPFGGFSSFAQTNDISIVGEWEIRFGMTGPDRGWFNYATVTSAHLILQESDPYRYRYANTDSSGNFMLEGLPPGRYRVEPDSLYSWSRNYTGTTSTYDLRTSPIVTGASLEIVGAFNLSGTARTLNGQPIAGMPIELLDPDGALVNGSQISTQADGSFRIDNLVTGSHRLQTRAPWIQSNGIQYQELAWVSIPRSAADNVTDMIVPPLLDRPEISVQTASGSAAQGIRVRVTGPYGYSRELTTDSNGRVTLPGWNANNPYLYPGTYAINGIDERLDWSATPTSFNLPTGEDSEGNPIALPTLTAVGSELTLSTLKGGASAPGTEVIAARITGMQNVQLEGVFGQTATNATRYENALVINLGTISLSGQSWDKVTGIEVWHYGGLNELINNAISEDLSDVTYELVIPGGEVIELSSPVLEYNTVGTRKMVPIESVSTLPDGDYTLRLRYTKPVFDKDVWNRWMLRLTVQRRTVDTIRTRTADANGSAFFNDLPGGDYLFAPALQTTGSLIKPANEVYPGEWIYSLDPQNIPSNADVSRTFDFAELHTLSGSVRTNGLPVAGTTLQAIDTVTLEVLDETTSLDDGTFQLNRVPSGAVTLIAKQNGYAFPDPSPFTWDPLQTDVADIRFIGAFNASISGTVTDAEGDPIANAPLTLRSIAKRFSGTSGPFQSRQWLEFELPIDTDVQIESVAFHFHSNYANEALYLIHPNGTSIKITDYNYGLGNRPITFVDGAPEASTQKLTYGAVRVSPSDPLSTFAGMPANGTWILRLYGVYPNDWGPFEIYDWGITIQPLIPGNASINSQLYTDTNGAFSATGLPPAFFEVIPESDRLIVSLDTAEFDLSRQSTASFTATAEEPTVTVNVQDSDGNAFENATVYLTTDNYSDEILTDANGVATITLPTISSGTVQAYVTDSHYGVPASATFDFNSSANPSISFTLYPRNTPQVTVEAKPDTLTYPVEFAESLLNFSSDIGGAFSFDVDAGDALSAGKTTVTWTFVPEDSLRYEPISGTTELFVDPASAELNVGDLSQVYDGNPKAVAVTTNPSGLPVSIDYPGGNLPTNAGNYNVTATITDPNYTASTSVTLNITKAPVTFVVPDATNGIIERRVDDAAILPAVTSDPAGLGITYSFINAQGTPAYGPTATVPTEIGSYILTISHESENYSGSVNLNYSVLPQSVSLTFPEADGTTVTRTYTGQAQAPVLATTNPANASLNYSYMGTANDGSAYGPSSSPPTSAGTYSVTATVTNPQLEGSASIDLIIERAAFVVDSSNVPSEMTAGTLLDLDNLIDSNTNHLTIAKAPASTVSYEALKDTILWGNSSGLPAQVMDVHPGYYGSGAALLPGGNLEIWGPYGELFKDTLHVEHIAAASIDGFGYTYVHWLNSDGSSVLGASTFPALGVVTGNIPNTARGSVTAMAAGNQHVLYLDTANQLFYISDYTSGGSLDAALGSIPEAVPTTGIRSIAAGELHAVVLDDTGNLHTWGLNVSGQLDIPDMGLAQPTAVFAGSQTSVAILDSGRAIAWGGQSFIADPPEGRQWIQAAVGGLDFVALLDDAGHVTIKGTGPYSAQPAAFSNGSVTQISAGPQTVIGLIPTNSIEPNNPGSLQLLLNHNDPHNLLPADDVLLEINVLPKVAQISLGEGNDGAYSREFSGSEVSQPAIQTVPAGLNYTLVYSGTANDGTVLPATSTPPIAAGNYTVRATVSDTVYTGYADFALSVLKANTSISVDSDVATFDGTEQSPTISTVPEGLSVILTDDEGNAFSATQPGAYPFVATVEDFNYSGQIAGELTIAKATASITHDLPNSLKYGDAPFTLTAMATSSEPVQFTVLSGPATIDDQGNLSATGVGSVIIELSVAANAQYEAANTSHSILIQPATATVSLRVPDGAVYTGGVFAAEAQTTPAGLDVNILYNGSTALPTQAGSYTVTASIADPRYTGTATAGFSIAKAPVLFFWDDLEQYFDGTGKQPTVRVEPEDLNLDVSFSGPYAEGDPVFGGTYSYSISASGPNHSGSSSANLVILPRPQVITMAPIADMTYGDTPQPILASMDSGRDVRISVSGPAYLDSNGHLVPTAAGTVTVRAEEALPAERDYAPATAVEQTIEVARATTGITIDLPYEPTYTGNPISVIAYASVSGTINQADIQVTYNGSPTPPTNAGTYTVEAVGQNSKYNGSATASLVIARATAGISGSALVTYTGEAQLPPVVITPDLPYTLTWDGGSAPVNVGTHAFSVTVDEPNYTGSFNGNLTIQQATVSLTLDANSANYTGQPISASITTDPSEIPVSQTFYTGPSYTIEVGSTVQNPGTYVLNASVTNPNYYGTLSGYFTVEPTAASFTADNAGLVYTGEALLPAITTIPDGIALDWSLSKDGQPVSEAIDAGTYTYTITPSDSGFTGSYSDSFTIAQATATVSLSDLTQVYTGDILYPTATTSPLGLNVSFTVEDGEGNSVESRDAATYSVTASISDNNYTGFTTETFTITPASDSITWNDATDLDVWDPVALGASVSSGRTVLYSVVSGDAVLAGNSLTLTNANPVTIEASVTTTGNYLDPSPVQRTFNPQFTTASVSLSGLAQTYSGNELQVTASTDPIGLTLATLYNGSTDLPVDAGAYSVSATIQSAGYLGSASGTLVIAPATADVNIESPNVVYTGSAITPTVTTVPVNLSLINVLTDGNGDPVAEAIDVGAYRLESSINETNYVGNASAVWNIIPAAAVIGFDEAVEGMLSAPYTGSTINHPTVTTVPDGLSVEFSYLNLQSGQNLGSNPPTERGLYMVTASIAETNYSGSTTAELLLGERAVSFSVAELVNGEVDRLFNNAPVVLPTITSTPEGIPYQLQFYSEGSDPSTATEDFPVSAGRYIVLVEATEPFDTGSTSFIVEITPQNAVASFSPPADTSPGTAFDPLALVTSECAAYLDVEILSGPISDTAQVLWGQSTPEEMFNVPNSLAYGIAAADMRFSQAAAILNTGDWVYWGYYANGSKTADPNNPYIDTAVGNLSMAALKQDGTVETLITFLNPGEANVPESIQGSVVDIAAGDRFYLVLLDDGSLEQWGTDSNEDPLEPIPTIDPALSWVAIDASRDLAAGVSSDGTLHVWGSSLEPTALNAPNQSGRIFTDVRVSSNGGIGLTDDNTLHPWGSAPTAVPSPSAPIVDFAVSLQHAHAIDSAGTLYSWGDTAAYEQRTAPAETNGHPKRRIWASQNHVLLAYADGQYRSYSQGEARLRYTITGCPNTADYSADQIFRVGEFAPTITFPEAVAGTVTKTYTGSPRGVTIQTIPSDLDYSIRYSGTTAAGEAFGPTSSQPTEAGSYTVEVLSLDSFHQGSETVDFVIAPANQSIAFSPTTYFPITEQPLMQATATSGLPVTFSIVSGPASLLNGQRLVAANNAAVVVEARQAGNANFNPAPAVQRTLYPQKLASIEFVNTEPVYNGSGWDVPQVITTPADLNVVLTYDDGSSFPTWPDTYTVGATINDDHYYGSATEDFLFQPKVTFTGDSFIYDNGFRLGPEFTIEPYFNTTKRYYEGDTDIGSSEPYAVGDYTLVVTLLGFSRTYSKDFSITKVPSTITFSGSSAPLVIGQPGSLLASSSTFTPVSFSIVEGDAILNDSTITPRAPGPLTVRATAQGTDNYEAPDPVEMTFYPTFSSVTINVTNTTKTFNGFGLSPDISLSESIGYDVTFDGSTSWPTQAGSYTYNIRAIASGKYGEATGTFTIAPKAETLSLDSSSYSYTGNLIQPAISVSKNGLAYSVSITDSEGQSADPINAGTYTLNAQVTDPNYSGSLVTSFTIDPAPVAFVFSEKVNDRIHRPLTGSPVPPPLVDVSPNGVAYSLEYKLATAGDEAWSTTPPTERGAYRVRVSSDTGNYTGSAIADLIVGARTLSFSVAESVEGVIETTYTGSPMNSPTITVSPAGAPYSISYTGTANDGSSYAASTPPTKSGTYTLELSPTDPLDEGSLSISVLINPANPVYSFTEPNDLRIGQSFDPLSLIDGPCSSTATVEVVSGPVNNRNAITWGGTSNNLTTLPAALDNGFIAAHYGYNQGVAATMDGGVVSWGAEDYSAAIEALNMPRVIDVASLGYDGQIALDENGNFHIWGTQWNSVEVVPTEIQGMGTAIEAGYEVYLAQLSDGTLYEWGDTSRYTRSMPSTLQDPNGPGVLDFDMEYELAGAVDGNGTVHLWGNSSNASVFSIPTAAQSGVQSIAVSSTGAIALKTDGTLVLWGDAPNIPFDANINGRATSIELARSYPSNHAHAIRDDGILVSWGTNSYINYSAFPSLLKDGSVAVVGLVADGNNALAQYAGSNLSISGPGTLTLRYTIENCPDYVDTVFEESFRIGFDALGFAFPDAIEGTVAETYIGSPITPNVTTSPAGIALSFTYTGTTTAGQPYGPTATAPTEAGTYSVSVRSDDPAWIGEDSVGLVITKATQSLAPAAQSEFLVGDTYNLPEFSDAGLPVSYSVTSGTASISDKVITFTHRGAVEVTATQAGNDNYTAAPDRVLSFQVKEVATIEFLNLEQPYTGSGRAASVRTTPEGLSVDLLYNGSASLPVSTGQYTVSASVNESDWTGQDTATLTISRARPSISLGQLSTTYTGTEQAPQIVTDPSGLPYSMEVSQNSQPVTPINAGLYTVRVVIDTETYSAEETLFYRIEPAPVNLSLSNLQQTYDFGSPVEPTVSADKSFSEPVVRYFQNGVEKRPTDAGQYTVLVSEGNPNLVGYAEGILSIAARSANINVTAGSATYTGEAILPIVTTSPADLPVGFAFTQEGNSVSEMIDVGTYAFTATVTGPNYSGTTSGTFNIEPATVTASLAETTLTYTGSVLEPTVLTDPANVPIEVTYSQLLAMGPTVVPNPILPGVYAVGLNSLDANYAFSDSQPLLTYTIESAQLAILTQPQGSSSGSVLATQPVIEIRDGQGNRVTSGDSASVVVSVEIVSGNNGTLSGTLTATAVNGVATFSDLALAGDIEEHYVLRFSSGSLAPTNSENVTVSHGPATQLAITTEPIGGASGTTLDTAPIIEVQDADGNRVTSGTTTSYVSVSIQSGTNGTLGGTTTVPAINGVASFTNLSLAGIVSENYVLRFSNDSLASVDSNSTTVSPGMASVATSLVTASPTSITADGTSTSTISIQLKDAQGNNTDVLQITDAVSLVTDYGTLLSDLVNEGNGRFTQVLRSTTLAQTATLTAYMGSNAIMDLATVGFTPGAISVDANGSNLTGADLTRVANGAETATITLQLRDAFGNDIKQPGVSIAFSTTLGTLSATSAQTDANGKAVVSLSSTTSGTANVSASIATVGDIQNGAPVEVVFEPGPATQLGMVTQPITDPQAKLLDTQPVVEILDAFGNRVADDNSIVVTVSLISLQSGTLEGTVQRSASNGVISFTDLELQGQPGIDYTLRFTSEPSLDSVDANPIQVSSFINIDGGTSATAAPFTTKHGSNSQPQTFQVTGTNLTAPITATAPTGFEVSVDAVNFASSAVLNPTGRIVNGTLHLRITENASAGEVYDGLSVTLSSSGATDRFIYTANSGNSVDRAQQSIQGFVELPIQTNESPPFVLSATATSGLPVTYSSSNPLVASISGNTITVQGLGTAIITASQEGNNNFLPAPDLEQFLVVATEHQKWRLENFGTQQNLGIAADEIDYDRDGLANILEYALGTSPVVPQRGSVRLLDSDSFSTGEPITVFQQTPPAYFGRFVRKINLTKAGIQYIAEFSEDLIHWEPSSTGISVVATAGDFEVVDIPFPETLSNGNPPRFFRIRVIPLPL